MPLNPPFPRGMKLDHGYVQVRIMSKGRPYCKNFGPDTPQARELAMIHLAEKRKEILLDKFGYGKKLPSKPFDEVSRLYMSIWGPQRKADGAPRHTDRAIRGTKGFIEHSLVPFFGRMPFESIRPLDVHQWRTFRLKAIAGTSVNREQAVLSSIFSHIETWVKTEQIPAFLIPDENPCTPVKFAPTLKRERVLSLAEIKQLKTSCLAMDAPLWDICLLALNSCLRAKDLAALDSGKSIDLIQAKTGKRLLLPIVPDRPLDYKNFRKRWERVIRSSGLFDVQFRDLRKTGANLLKDAGYTTKQVSEYLGHTNTKTTEVYLVPDADKLKPLADALAKITGGL